MASYNVNYDDERFTQVETEKQNELNKYNNTFDGLIEERENISKQQQEIVDNWANTQQQIANDNLQHQIDLYNQKQEKAEKDYQKEAKASYIDYQKEVDKYGVSRENVVSNGLSNSGYAESSKVDMYNTYQNRIATARESMNNIKLEFDNAIKEAQLSNNATLAEIAYEQMKQKLDIVLEGFNYKDTQTQNKLNWEYNINNNYYDRYKDVESQINYENEQAEAIRQYNEQMAFNNKQQKLEQQRWEKEMEYQKKQDAIANAQRWAQINVSKTSTSGSSSTNLTNGSNNSKKITNVKNNSPALSTNKANSWYSTNIDKPYFNGGLTEAQLEKILDSGLSSGVINKNDVDKILSTFGL